MATEPTNADEVDTLENNGGDTNTDPPVRTLEETQLTNGVNEFGYAVGYGVQDETGAFSSLRRNPETGELYDPGGITSPFAGVDPGVGANDNNPPPSTVTTQAQADVQGNVTANDLVSPQPNILDEYANYTYSASFYLMNTEEYNRLVRSVKKNITGYNLLFQIGRAHV